MPHSVNYYTWDLLKNLSNIVLDNTEFTESKRGCIVDIGMGVSTAVLSQLSMHHSRHHFSCDIKHKIYFKYKKYCENYLWHPLVCDSFLFLELLPNIFKKYNTRPVIVFIDGAHKYRTVLKEVHFFLKWLIPGGIIFLHDTYPPCEEWVSNKGFKCGDVYRVRQKLEKNKNLYTFTWTYKKSSQNCGLTMITNKVKHRPFYQL